MERTSLSARATPNPNFRAAEFHPLFQAVFSLERCRSLLDFRVGPIPYWGLIRLPLLIRLVDRVHGELDSGDIFLKPRRARLSAFSYALASLSGLRRHTDKDFVFVCTGVNWEKRGAAFFNSRVDYFAERLPRDRTLLIEGADGLRYRRPRAIEPVARKGGLTLPGAAWARFGRLGRAENARLLEFMALLRDFVADGVTDSDYALLEEHLRRGLLRSKVYLGVCERLLERLKPRLLFVESAHFGFDIELIAAARERGITTVEWQHGAANPFCPYHNFEPALLAAGYDRCLPDYFLSYGDFWNRFLTTSARIVTIGNPHVAAALGRPRRAEMVDDRVYFLSSAGPAQRCVEWLRELVAEGFAVTFRPHPVERPLLRSRYGSIFEDLGIRVDVGDDFYGELRSGHSIVLGDGQSTSIFEALALAGPNVFVMEMGSAPARGMPIHALLRTVSSARELRKRLAEEPGRTIAIDDLFARDWEQRFAGFVELALGD